MGKRISKQLQKVIKNMVIGQWHSASELNTSVNNLDSLYTKNIVDRKVINPAEPACLGIKFALRY